MKTSVLHMCFVKLTVICYSRCGFRFFFFFCDAGIVFGSSFLNKQDYSSQACPASPDSLLS